jgi:anti-repressor protein
MNELEIFNYSGKQVRTAFADQTNVFIGKDVCDVLGISKYRDALAQLDEDERVSVVVDTLGGQQTMVGVTEPGVWALMLISRSPEVKPFRRWLTHEVLPAIRRTGSYSNRDLDLGNPADVVVLAERSLQTAKAFMAERERRLALEGPAAHAETFRSANGLRAIGDVANDFKALAKTRYPDVKVISQYVFDHAALAGLIIRGNTVRHNQPMSQAVRAGWVEPHRAQYDTHTRGIQTTVTARLTPRGEARLWDHLINYIETHHTLEIRESA